PESEDEDEGEQPATASRQQNKQPEIKASFLMVDIPGEAWGIRRKRAGHKSCRNHDHWPAARPPSNQSGPDPRPRSARPPGRKSPDPISSPSFKSEKEKSI